MSIRTDAPTAQRSNIAATAGWDERTRVIVQPIAPPSILGLFGFAGATFIVSAQLAGWYGGTSSPLFLFPFAALFGGVAQFASGMWAYRARDGLATAMHGMWGSFWIAYGILFLLDAFNAVTVPASGKFPELGYWFLVLAVITAFGAIAALADNLGLFATLATLAVGAALLAIRYLVGDHDWQTAGGYVLIASAILATYTAAAMMLEASYRRMILPLGKPRSKEADVPGERFTKPVEYPRGMPGAPQGQ